MRYRQRGIASLTENRERFSHDRVTVHACNVYVRSVTSHDVAMKDTSDRIGDRLYLRGDLIH